MKTRMPWRVAVCALCFPAGAAAERANIDIYGTLVPFMEYAGTRNATPAGFMGRATQVTSYTGVNDPYRLRMTANTSNLGFRGTVDLFGDDLKVTWQIESAVPIDGDPGGNTIASRNSHLGLTGPWGTLIFGIWDTPYKISNLLTINPIKAGFVPEFNAVLNTPGFGVVALNNARGHADTPSDAAFFRRESNGTQYWSPKFFGFSARAAYYMNEGKTVATAMAPSINPYIVSAMAAYDEGGLHARYSFELHNDFFGMAQLGGSKPAYTNRSSTDFGNNVVAYYTLSLPDFSLRVLGAFDFLRYKSDDTMPGAVNMYSRPAFYALIEPAILNHHVWLAYGQALPGSCERVGGAACSTDGLGATDLSVGYIYRFSENTDVFAVGYRVINKESGRYAPVPPIGGTIAAGADTLGVGIGLIYKFSAEIASLE
jgi:predicted porin